MTEAQAIRTIALSSEGPKVRKALAALRPEQRRVYAAVMRDVQRAERALEQEERRTKAARGHASPWSPLGEPDHLLAAIEYLEAVGRLRMRIRYDRRNSVATVAIGRLPRRGGIGYIVVAVPSDCMPASPRWDEDLRVLASRWCTSQEFRKQRAVGVSLHGIPSGEYRLAVVVTTEKGAADRLLHQRYEPSTVKGPDREALVQDLLTLHSLPERTIGARDVRMAVPLTAQRDAPTMRRAC
jgi:hypothetical protein